MCATTSSSLNVAATTARASARELSGRFVVSNSNAARCVTFYRVSELDLDNVQRREWNRRFAAAYVRALDLTGDDAASIQAEIIEKLAAGELLNDAALVKRVRRMQIDEELRARGLTQEQIDAVRLQVYGTFAHDSYRGQLSRLLELVIQGNDSARQRIREQLDDAARDPEVTPEQLQALEQLVRDTLEEDET
jgi:hypothetical protein